MKPQHRRNRLSGGWLVAAGSLVLAGCAVAPEEDPVYIRMNDIDGRVQRIERVLTNQSLLELSQRLDRLQADLRALRGDVELLQNQSEGGKAQTRTLYSDLDKRLAALETLSGLGAPGAAPGTPPAAPAAAGEQASYDAAMSALTGADYPKAIQHFKTFLASFPASPLASNAQYWMGEAYYVTQQYDQAMAAFRKVLTDWPDSRKAPDALVKVGYTQAAMGRANEARATFEDVVRRFPGTDAAKLATERLKPRPVGSR